MSALFPLLHRLLEELVQKEREFQVLLHQAIEEKDEEIRNLQLRSQPIGKWEEFLRKNFMLATDEKVPAKHLFILLSQSQQRCFIVLLLAVFALK